MAIRLVGPHTMHTILQKLAGSDRRSIGRSNDVVADVLAEPTLFKEVFAGMLSEDKVVRMRAADAVAKITARHPEHLVPFKNTLVGPVASTDQIEVRWHVAQMLPRVHWNTTERKKVMGILREYLNDDSSIVKTFAMQAHAELARQFPELRPTVLRRLREPTATGTPAMRARGRKILAECRGPQQYTKRSSSKAKVRG